MKFIQLHMATKLSEIEFFQLEKILQVVLLLILFVELFGISTFPEVRLISLVNPS